MEEPEDEVFCWRNVTVLDEAVEIGEDNPKADDQEGSNDIDQHWLAELLNPQSYVIRPCGRNPYLIKPFFLWLSPLQSLNRKRDSLRVK